jgi:hypothetical protein
MIVLTLDSMTDIVERLRTVDISWSQEGEWCAEAADEIEQLRKDKQHGFELMDAFIIRIHRLKQVLRLIANMESDPEFGVLPMTTVQKIAQDALDEE